MEAKVVYDNKRDRELVELSTAKFPIFVDYINVNTNKEGFQIKSHWGAIENPFVLVTLEKDIIKVFYSDGEGDSAVQQFVNWLNK